MESYKTTHDFILRKDTTTNRMSVDIFISRIEDFKDEIERYRDKLSDEHQEQINYCNSLLLSSDALIVKVEDEKEIFDEEVYNQVYVNHVKKFDEAFHNS